MLHTIFILNYDFVDEDNSPKDQRKWVRNLVCAVAEGLALATSPGWRSKPRSRARHPIVHLPSLAQLPIISVLGALAAGRWPAAAR